VSQGWDTWIIGRVAQGPLVISTLVSLGWDTWLAFGLWFDLSIKACLILDYGVNMSLIVSFDRDRI